MHFETEPEAPPLRYQSFELPWEPVRPPRSEETIRRVAEEHWRADTLRTAFSYQERIVVHNLLCLVIVDGDLQELVDGYVFPPPYRLPVPRPRRGSQAASDAATGRFPSRGSLRAAVQAVDPSLDVLIPLIPFNIGISIGLYDARLRAGARRLCWLLALPFDLVQNQEEAVSDVHHSIRLQCSSRMTTEQVKEMVDTIQSGKRAQLSSLRRFAKVAGFAVVGSGIVITGGLLAAPLLAPAYASLVSGVSATVHSVGTVGSYALGTGAAAAAVAGAAGAVASCVETAGVLTPFITTASIAAVFGLGGAAIGGRKGYRRTDNVDVFKIRSVNDVETFSANPHDAAVDTLLALSTHTNQTANAPAGGSALSTPFDLVNVVEDDSMPGIVVPSYTRYIAMGHVTKLKSVKKRFRQVVFALDSQLTGFELRCRAIKLVAGVWGLAPPAFIPAGNSGICACMNRWAQPTGAGLVLCYESVTISTTTGRAPLRLWVRVYYDFFGQWELSSYVEDLDQPFDPMASEKVLSSNRSTGSYTRTQGGVTMELHTKPFVYLKVYLADAMSVNFQRVVFPSQELTQMAQEYAKEIRSRRRIGISFVNKSRHTITLRETHVLTGVRWEKTTSPHRVDPKEASLTMFCNKPWTLEGVSGYYMLEVDNNSDDPKLKRYFLRLDFAVTGRSQTLLGAAVAGPNAMLLKTGEPVLTAVSKKGSDIELPDGLFFDAVLQADSKTNILQLIIRNDVESKTGGEPRVEHKKEAALAFGVCGFISVFDPRRAASDQQVALWQPVLTKAGLLGLNEGYVVHWEDNYLTQFAGSVDLDLNLQMADRVSKKGFKKVTKTLKKQMQKQLLQSVVFSGFRAYKSLLGAFNIPLYAVWAADVIDNTFAVLSNRSVYAGKDLAVALLDEKRGRRPVSLVGFSFGAKVIVECLCELERVDALSVVENVYLLGGTFPADTALWQRLRRVVAGRLVNVYTRNDWALWMMYKANDVNMKPMAGITAVNVPGVENVDLTPLVLQHSEYASRLADVLDAIPTRPTQETWNPKNRLGSPGLIAPHPKAKSLVRSMGKSFSSVINNAPFCSFALRNSIVTDIDGFDTSIEFVDCSVFNGFFDFFPPHDTDAAQAGVFGAVGTPNQPMGGAIVFRLHLCPFAHNDVFFVVYFYGESRDDARVAVDLRLMDAPCTSAAGCSPTGTGSPCSTAPEPPASPTSPMSPSSLESDPHFVDGQVYDPDTEECLATRENARLAELLHDWTASLEEIRVLVETSAHQVSREDRSHLFGISVPMTHTFVDGSQSGTVQIKLDRSSGGVVINVLALFTEVSTDAQRKSFSERIYDKTYGVYCTTLHRSTVLPATAPLHTESDLEKTLRELGVQIRAERNRVRAAAGTMYADRPIVILNAGDVPLYFGEEDFHYDGVVKSGAVQWLRFPPPEIPPHMFTVMIVKNFRHGGAFPTIRYETVDETCGFDVVSTLPTSDVTVKRGIQCYPVVEFPIQGAVSLTSVQHSGVSFHVVRMSPETTDADTARKTRLPRTKQEKLKEAGWYVAQ